MVQQTIELGSGYTELGATTSDGSEVTINTANFTDSVGTYSIYYDSTDTAGNDAVQVVRTVNVVDTTPPVITLNGTNPQTIELGSGYTELGATTSDGSEVTINTANFTDSVGTYSIYYDSTDTAGNDATQVVRTIIVYDTISPIITLNGTNPQTIELGSGYTELGATTSDGSEVTINTANFTDSVGTYSIYYDSTDTAGNDAVQVVRTVNVVDTTPPVITLNGTNPQTIELGSGYTELGATTSDGSEVTINTANFTDSVDTYSIYYDSTDTAGNDAVQVVRTVNVVDTTPPVITLNGTNPQTIELGSGYTELGATTNDGSQVTINSDEFRDTVGTYSIYYDSTDTAGNNATQVVRTVNVVDATPPVITNITSNTTTGTLKVGDTITFTLAIDSAENDATINGTYNSVPLFWNSANNGTTYTAIYTVSEGDTDQSTPLQITNVIITNSIGINTSQPFDGTDVLVTIDANSPKFTRAETISTSQIGIILDQNVTNNTASPNDFTLGGVTDGSIGSIAYVSGSAIVLDVTGATISDTDSVTISYNRTSGSFDEASGNSLLYFAENVTNTLDTTPLVITNITSNTTTGTLKVGDTITFTLAIDSAENDATINGTYNSVPLFWNSANNGTTYTAIYTISEGDTDQSTPLQITNVIITNSIGINTSQPFDGTDVLVTIDANSPKFTRAETISTSQIGIILDQNVTNNTASPNDFTLGGVTDGSIGSIAYVSGSAIVLDVTGATISDTDSVTISYNRTSGSFDEASGNSLLYFAENVTNTLDTTPLVITNITSNTTTGTLKVGDTITFTLAIDSAENDATINGTYNSVPLFWNSANNGTTYTAIYTISEGDTDQSTPLQITNVIITNSIGINTSQPFDGTDVLVTIDANSPKFTRAETISTSQIGIILDQNVTNNTASPNDFTLGGVTDGSIGSIAYVSGSAIVLDVTGATISDTDSVTISYNRTSGSFDEASGNSLLYFAENVTNTLDTTPPVITLNGANPQTIELGSGYTELGATTSDDSEVTINSDEFRDIVGTYSIYYDSTDTAGNSATQVIRTVNVVDTTSPVITLNGVNPQTIELGNGYTELGATTNDGSQVIINTTNFTDSVGTYSIYYDSMDASGNDATQVIRIVNVVDTTPPVITLSGANPQTIELGSGYTELGVTTSDGSQVIINTTNFTDSVGTYSIYYDSMDASGNNATQVIRTVNVVDTTSPIITLNGTNPQTIELGSGYTELGVTTDDGSEVTINSDEFRDIVGTYSIYYDSTDTAGNNATQVNRTVNVVDTIPPVITLNGTNPQTIEFGDGYAELGATTSDGSSVTINATEFTDEIGSYSIYYDSTDTAGNNATQVNRTVNVVDTTPPIIILSGPNPQIIEFGDGYAELGATTSDGSQVIINTANFTDSVGTYSIYYDSMDASGNNATQVIRTVNVVDTTSPIITLNGTNPQIIEFGDGYAELGATTSDGSQVIINTANFTDSVGTYSIYYDSTDTAGNNATQVNRTVNVVDTTPPIIILSGPSPQIIEFGDGYAELGAITNDGSQVIINTANFTDSVGTYSIYYDSTDTAGNNATQVNRTVNVVDTTPPIIILSGPNPQIIEFGDGYAELGAITNDGSQVTIDTANFTDSVGTYSIYYDSTDTAGNNATQVNRTVNVVDTTPPIIILSGPNPQIIEFGDGYAELGAITNDGSQVTIDTANFTDSVGTYSIYYDSMDASGNNAIQVNRTVNVVDTTPPVITLNGVNPQTIELGSGYTELGVTTDDGSQVTINSDEFRDTVGTYSIYYDSTDTAGNDATQVIRTVNVVDTTSPIITLNGTNPQIIEFGDGYAELGATTSDGSQVIINTANFTDSVGTYSIYYDSMDASGNNAIQVNRTVNVVDTTPPVITLNGTNPQTIELGSGYTELGAITNDGSQVTINSDEFRDIVGTYSIYYDSTDTAGNDATQVIRAVNVVDTTPPVITLNGVNPQTIELGSGYTELGVTTDDGSQVTINSDEFRDIVGTYSIYYDSTDTAGNDATQVIRTVNVVDTTSPIITLNGTNPQIIEFGDGYAELGAITNDGSQVTINTANFTDSVGTYSIYYDSMDASGNNAIQVNRTVNVVDTTPPVITLNGTNPQTIELGSGYTELGAITNDGSQVTINSDEFRDIVGTYSIYYDSTDTAGNDATQVIRTVNVVDTTSPIITLNGTNPQIIEFGDGYAELGAITNDGSQVTIDTANFTDSVGTYSIYYDSMDASGNNAIQVNRTVNVVDTTPPVITLNGTNPQTIELGSGYTELGAITNDGSQVTINSDEFRDIVGTYSIYYDSTDTVGNDAIQVIRTVNVVDTTSPVITNITSNTTTGTLKVGDTITFTLTIYSAENDATINGTYNSVPLFWNSTDNGTTYTADYTVSEGDMDQTAPLQITDVTITDDSNNTSMPFDGTDIQSTIDANSPKFSRAQTITTLQIAIIVDQNVANNAVSSNDFTLGGVDGGSIGSIAYILGSAIVLDVTGATISDTDSVTISYNRTFGSFDEPSGNSLLNFAENVTNTLDTTPPVITLNGANPQTIELGSGYTELGAITNDGSQVTINSDEFRDTVGTYSIYYDSTDTVGNDAIQVIRTVNVVDTTPPVITNITSNTTTGTLKVGDTITFTLTIDSAENDATINGTYNSVPLFWNSTNNGTTYTAIYTVSEGETDQTAPLQITDVTITDSMGSTSLPFDGTDIQSTIDANSPKFSRAQTITTLQIGVVLDQGVTYNVASPNDFTLGGVDGGSIGSIAYILGSAIVLDVTGATISDTDSVTISYNRTFGSFDEPSGNSLLNFAENVTNTLDTTPPVITLNGANPQTIELGSGYTELGAITNDGSQVTINSDEFRDIVDTYSIYYDSTDTVGNDAIQVIRTVNVIVITPPVSCTPPASGDWTVRESCTINSNTTVQGNVIVQNGSVLTIPSGVTVDIDFVSFNLTVQSGSGVFIESGGTVT